MRMDEAAEQLGLSQRAIKYYEKEGLLKVKRDENGYRNFDEHDLERLKKITLYRKLGIAVKDIENLLKTEDSARLREIFAQKRDQLRQDQTQLQLLESISTTAIWTKHSSKSTTKQSVRQFRTCSRALLAITLCIISCPIYRSGSQRPSSKKLIGGSWHSGIRR